MVLNSYFCPIRAVVASVTPPSTSSPTMTEAASILVSVSRKNQALAHSLGVSDNGEQYKSASEQSLPLVPTIGAVGVVPCATVAASTNARFATPTSQHSPALVPAIRATIYRETEKRADGRQSNGRTRDDKKRESLDPSFIKTHLSAFFHTGGSLRQYCISNDIISSYNTLRNYANQIDSGLDVDRSLEELFDTKKEAKRKRMQDLHEYNKYLTPDDEKMVAATIGQLAYFGAAVSHTDAKQFIRLLIQQDAPDGVELDPPSDKYVSKIMKLHNLKTNAKVSSVDVKRMEAANADTLDAFALKADASIRILNALGLCEYENFADVPADNIFGADEFGSIAAKKYDGQIIPKEASQAGKRVFQFSTQGDNSKQTFHSTVMYTSCANGMFL